MSRPITYGAAGIIALAGTIAMFADRPVQAAGAGCLPTGQTATVLRVADMRRDAGFIRSAALTIALRLKDGRTVVCTGPDAFASLAFGDVVDGAGLKPAGR